MINNLFQTTKEISNLYPDRNILLRLAKMQEELGELAEPTLKLLGYKGTLSSPFELMDNQAEEAIDVLIVALDLIHCLNIEEIEFEKILSKKLDKWKSAIQKSILLNQNT